MKCDMCSRDDNRPHYHGFLEVGTEKNPKTKHVWVCAGCKGEDEEHRDDG